MTTEYREVEHSFSLASLMFGLMALGIGPLAVLIFGARALKRDVETIRIPTTSIPWDEALSIAQAGFRQTGRMAFQYMELRRDLDGDRDREIMREHGGQNCRACGVFFMPHAEKSWTASGCCSKACFAAFSPRTGPLAPAPTQAETLVAAPSVGLPDTVKVICPCGSEFGVAKMYVGVLRACPQCGAKSMVG